MEMLNEDFQQIFEIDISNGDVQWKSPMEIVNGDVQDDQWRCSMDMFNEEFQ